MLEKVKKTHSSANKKSQMQVMYEFSPLPVEELERRINNAFDILFEKVFKTYYKTKK